MYQQKKKKFTGEENPTNVIWFNNQEIQDNIAKRPANLKQKRCFFLKKKNKQIPKSIITLTLCRLTSLALGRADWQNTIKRHTGFFILFNKRFAGHSSITPSRRWRRQVGNGFTLNHRLIMRSITNSEGLSIRKNRFSGNWKQKRKRHKKVIK